MKKVFVVLSLSSLMFTACKKNEEIKPTPNPPVITAPVVNKPTNTTPTNDSISLVLKFSFNTPLGFKLSYKYDTNNVHLLLNGVKIPLKKLLIDTGKNGIIQIRNTNITKFYVNKGDKFTFIVDSLIYTNNNVEYPLNIKINAETNVGQISVENNPTNGTPVGRYIGCDPQYTYNKWYVGKPFIWEYIIK